MSMTLSRLTSENALPLRWPTSMGSPICMCSPSLVETSWTRGNCTWTTAKSSTNAPSTSPANNPLTANVPTAWCTDVPEHRIRYFQCRRIGSRQCAALRAVEALDSLGNGGPIGGPIRRHGSRRCAYRMFLMHDLIAPRGVKGGENRATTQSRAWFRIDGQPRMRRRDSHVGKTIDVTDMSFGPEVLRSELPVLINFWAPWCGPCKAIAPIVEELAEEYAGHLKVMKLDVDGNPNTPVTYGVQSIPTLLLFKDGELIEQIKGAVPKLRIVDALKRVVPSASMHN